MRFITTLSGLTICLILTAASQQTGIVNRQIGSAREPKEDTSVVSLDFCYSCLPEDAKGYKASYEQLPAYAALSNDQKASFGPSFTICSSSSNPGGFFQVFFALLGQDGQLAIQALLMNDVERATLFLIIGKDTIAHSPNISIPLVFPHQWIRSCLAVSTHSGHVQWVIDGRVVENTTYEIGNIFPNNLA